MLYVSLFVSLLVLVIVNWVVCCPVRGLAGPLLFALFILVILSCGVGFFPGVAIQGILLGIAAVGCWGPRRRLRFFLPLSCGITLAAYAPCVYFGLQFAREQDRLRGRFPYESMGHRLADGTPSPHPEPLPPATAERLDRLEERLAGKGFSRELMLHRLHESTVSRFINSPGFGAVRMIRPYEQGLTLHVYSPVPQPGSRAAPTSLAGLSERSPAAVLTPFAELHETSVQDFVYPEGFGYVKDRDHVAGFEPHQFKEAHQPSESWNVETIDLVGLLLHREPVAYVSANLPRMDELREAPTRPLDPFERAGLRSLQGGEDLFLRQAGSGLWMLGALRSTKQCVSCHGGRRGDLLGAFSYSLRRVGP
jgi:hypothetical protein